MTNDAIPEEDIGLPTEGFNDDPEAPSDNALDADPRTDALPSESDPLETDSFLFEDEDPLHEPSETADPLAETESEVIVETTEPTLSAPSEGDRDAELIGVLSEKLDGIETMITQLSQEFSGKLKYDAHKEDIIDKLHQELQEYKQDLLKKLVLSFVLDVIKLADDIRKWISHFKALDASQRDPIKLFRYLEAIPSDLEDIFYWQGVKPFTTQEGVFDPTRQRALKKIPTEDPELDKTIAQSVRPGYEWEGKVIRQEMVAVYMHTKTAD